MRHRLAAASLAAFLLTTAPAIAHGPPQVTGGPVGTVATRDAEFKLTYDEPAPGQSFECKLDSQAWKPCTESEMPEGKAVYKALPDGPHSFQARRVSSLPQDPLGDDEPSSPRTWTVDPAGGAPATPPPLPDGIPAPCNGVVQITDAAADSHHKNPDVLRVWFDRTGGAPTVNVEVSELGPAIDHQENNAVFWRVIFTTSDGQRRYVDASAPRSGDVTYGFGSAKGLDVTPEGATTGKLKPGKPGVVQIRIPDGLVPAGAKLAQPVAVAGETASLGGEPSYFERAPGGEDPADPKETAVGADWLAADCAPPAAGGLSAVSLDGQAAAVRFGRTVKVTGRVVPATPGIPVELVDDRDRPLVTVPTLADGRFIARVRPGNDLGIRARAQGVTSGTFAVDVQEVISLKLRKVKGGRRATGSVSPFSAGRVEIQLRTGGQWIEVGSAKLRRSRYAVTLRGVGRGKLRAVFVPAVKATPRGAAAGPVATAAHAAVRSTSPRAGSTVPRALRAVSVTFKSRIIGGSLIVRRRGGGQVSTGRGRIDGGNRLRTVLRSGLRPGRYVASWTSISANDGHRQKSTFSFRLS